jgi:ferrochelatase
MSNPGVLLVNLGSPDSPSVGDVRKYLREFLMDKRVLDAPYPVRFCIVNFAILPSRPKQSAEAYAKVWQPEGSPLVSMGRRVHTELQRRVGVPVELAMRYRSPSIESAIKNLRDQGVDKILLIPMFPHYAMSSYETAMARVSEIVAKAAPHISLEVIPPYYNDPAYIDALVASAAPYLERDYDHLLFSFHGIPERHLKQVDPTGCHCLKKENCCVAPSPAHATCYRAQCFKTVEAFVQKAPISRYSIAFQSRLGKDPWLTPYADKEIERLANDGVKTLLVICPSFVADCLETIEEIGIRGRESLLSAGGRELVLIPCLNDHPRWIAALEKMISRLNDRPSASAAQPILVNRK